MLQLIVPNVSAIEKYIRSVGVSTFPAGNTYWYEDVPQIPAKFATHYFLIKTSQPGKKHVLLLNGAEYTTFIPDKEDYYIGLNLQQDIYDYQLIAGTESYSGSFQISLKELIFWNWIQKLVPSFNNLQIQEDLINTLGNEFLFELIYPSELLNYGTTPLSLKLFLSSGNENSPSRGLLGFSSALFNKPVKNISAGNDLVDSQDSYSQITFPLPYDTISRKKAFSVLHHPDDINLVNSDMVDIEKIDRRQFSPSAIDFTAKLTVNSHVPSEKYLPTDFRFRVISADYQDFNVLKKPIINSFITSTPYVIFTKSAYLTPVFENGIGTIDGVEVISGNTHMVTPTVTTSYTLSVSNSVGSVVTKTITVGVNSEPVINLFESDNYIVTYGGSITLSAYFGGKDVIGQINSSYIKPSSFLITAVESLQTTQFTKITLPGHNFSANDIIKVTGVTGMLEINNKIATISSVTIDTITIPLDSSKFKTYGSGGSVSLTTSLSSTITEYLKDSNENQYISNGTLLTINPTQSKTYSLIITNGITTLQKDLFVEVLPAGFSLISSNSRVLSGFPVLLTPNFIGQNATINGTTVYSGSILTVHPTETTTYTLQVDGVPYVTTTVEVVSDNSSVPFIDSMYQDLEVKTSFVGVNAPNFSKWNLYGLLNKNLTAITRAKPGIFSCSDHGLNTGEKIQFNNEILLSKIQGITNASSAVLTVPGHKFVVGDRVFISGVKGMFEINNKKAIISSKNDDTITVDINSTNYEYYLSGGTVSSGMFEINNTTYRVVYRDRNTFSISSTEPVKIINISQASPAVVLTEKPHNLVTGDRVILYQIDGMKLLNNVIETITKTSDTTFTIPIDTSSIAYDTFKGAAYLLKLVDTTDYTTFEEGNLSLYVKTGFGDEEVNVQDYVEGELADLTLLNNPTNLKNSLNSNYDVVYTQGYNGNGFRGKIQVQTSINPTGAYVTNFYIYNNGEKYKTGERISVPVPSSLVISSINQSNPAKVTCTTDHGLKSGDQIKFTDLPGLSTMNNLNNNTYTIVKTSATEFTLKNVSGTNIDSTLFNSYSSGTGTINIFLNALVTLINQKDSDLDIKFYASQATLMNEDGSIPVSLSFYKKKLNVYKKIENVHIFKNTSIEFSNLSLTQNESTIYDLVIHRDEIPTSEQILKNFAKEFDIDENAFIISINDYKNKPETVLPFIIKNNITTNELALVKMLQITFSFITIKESKKRFNEDTGLKSLNLVGEFLITDESELIRRGINRLSPVEPVKLDLNLGENKTVDFIWQEAPTQIKIETNDDINWSLYANAMNAEIETAEDLESSPSDLIVSTAKFPDVLTPPSDVITRDDDSVTSPDYLNVTLAQASVVAGTISYQWYKDGNPVGSEITTTRGVGSWYTSSYDYTIVGGSSTGKATSANNGRYYCKITNTLSNKSKTTTTQSAEVFSVNRPSRMPAQLSTAYVGGAFSTKVEPTGNATLTYQWKKSTGVVKAITPPITFLSGLDSLSRVTCTSHGFKTGDVVEFSNISGSSILNNLIATVTYINNNEFYIRYDIVGLGLAGSNTYTSATLSAKKITGITKNSTTTIDCPSHPFITNDIVIFSEIEGILNLSGLSGTVTYIDPNSFSVNIDTSSFAGTFTASSTDSDSLKNLVMKTVDISSATDNRFYISTAAYSDTGLYSCTTTNTYKGLKSLNRSSEFTVIKTEPATGPVFTRQPENISFSKVGAYTFYSLAKNVVPLVSPYSDGVTYQWYKDNSIIPQETKENLTIQILSLTNQPSSYYCLARNDLGYTTQSQTVKLLYVEIVSPQPLIYDIFPIPAVSKLNISPSVNGKSTWDLIADGKLKLTTSGTWKITPVGGNCDARIKVWGAAGGAGGVDLITGNTYNDQNTDFAYGGGGGYAEGYLNGGLLNSTDYYFVVGGGGKKGANNAAGSGGGLGGYNGGGRGGNAGGTNTSGAGGGGAGGSGIYLNSPFTPSYSPSTDNILIVGGGAGAGGEGEFDSTGYYKTLNASAVKILNDGNRSTVVTWAGGPRLTLSPGSNATDKNGDGGGNGGGGAGWYGGKSGKTGNGDYTDGDANGYGGISGSSFYNTSKFTPVSSRIFNPIESPLETPGQASTIARNSAGQTFEDWNNTAGQGGLGDGADGLIVLQVETYTRSGISLTVAEGNRAVFVINNGVSDPAATYQWYKGNIQSPITIAKSPIYTIPATNLLDEANYFCVVKKNGETITSKNVNLYISKIPIFSTQPQSTTIGSAISTTLSVIANGNGTLTYQWYRNETLITGQTSPSISVNDTASYYCIATNTRNGVPVSATSNSASTSSSNEDCNITGGTAFSIVLQLAKCEYGDNPPIGAVIEVPGSVFTYNGTYWQQTR